MGYVVEVACDRSHLQAVVQKCMGSENHACYLKGCTKSQQSEAPVDMSTSSKTVNHVHSSTLASLKIKTNSCADISRKAGVEAICRMQTIVYGSLPFSCSNKGSRETMNLLLEAANFILYIQLNTFLSTAVTDWAITCACAESCNWGIPVDRIQKGQLH